MENKDLIMQVIHDVVDDTYSNYLKDFGDIISDY